MVIFQFCAVQISKAEPYLQRNSWLLCHMHFLSCTFIPTIIPIFPNAVPGRD